MGYGWTGWSVLVATTGRPEECRTALERTGDYETQLAVRRRQAL